MDLLALFRRQPMPESHHVHADREEARIEMIRAWLDANGDRLGRHLSERHGLPLAFDLARPGLRRGEMGFDPIGKWTQLERLTDAVCQYFLTDDIRVRREKGLVVFSVPLPVELRRPTTCRDLPTAEGWSASVGWTESGKVERVNFDVWPHFGVFGPTGSGKTVLLRGMLVSLLRVHGPDALRVIVVGGKPEDWQIMDAVPQSWGHYPRAEAKAAVEWVIAEYYRRQAIGQKLPRIVLVVDDVVALLSKAGGFPELVAPLEVVVSQTRAYGISLWLGSQSAASDGTGSSLVSKQLGRKFARGAANAQDAYNLTGVKDSGMEKYGPGEWSSVETGSARLVYVPYMTNEDAERMVRLAQPDLAPWLAETGERPHISSVSSVSPPVEGGFRLVQPPKLPSEALTGLTGLTDREAEMVRMLREHKSPHEIAVTLTGQRGGPTYQAKVREVKVLIARWLPPLDANAECDAILRDRLKGGSAA